MVVRLARALLFLLVASGAARAQHGDGASSPRGAPAEAKQFAFLVGEFELVVRPAASGLGQKIHGVPKMVGTWTGRRAMDGYGIDDDLRITDASGNPRMLSHAVRYYNASAKRWTVSSIDVYRGVFTTSSAQWKDNEMIATSHGTDAEGKVYASRGRYFEITPTSFRFRQDRSFDEGKSWEEGVLSIDAKRVAPAAPRE
jgi:hypothetical protein